MSRAACAIIDLEALKHNLSRVKAFASSQKIIAMIKADAYGHGILRVATALEHADAFGVACLEEAQILRHAGIKNTIILMEGFFKADELTIIDQLNLDVVIHDSYQLEILNQIQLEKPLNIWLKIDTGMHRLGFSFEQAGEVWQQLSEHPNVAGEPKLMTHFACADDVESPLTKQQIQKFQKATQSIKAEKSLANSAAILEWPQTHGDWVRPGIMLYGISPFLASRGQFYDLKPVMTLQSEIIAIHPIKKGDVVGYGATWQAPEDMLVGVVAMGYGDGYPRHAPSGTPILVNNQRVPLIGRVSMDMLTVDLRTVIEPKIGMAVVLWGKGLPVEEIAEHADTIAYELLCGITRRVAVKALDSAGD